MQICLSYCRVRIGGKANVVLSILLVTIGTCVLDTAIREAIGNPDKRHTSGEDTRTPTHDIEVIVVNGITEAKAWREERLEGWEVIIRHPTFLSNRRVIKR